MRRSKLQFDFVATFVSFKILYIFFNQIFLFTKRHTQVIGGHVALMHSILHKWHKEEMKEHAG